MTSEDFERMREQQGRRCALCRRAATTLVVDHDHETGRVRGLLCRPCNHRVLPALEQPGYIDRVIKYLITEE